MELKETEFEGLFILKGNYRTDERGHFFKYYDDDVKNKLLPNPFECYLSKSKKNAVRGCHFQKNEYGQGKLVFCVEGAFIDVAVDLRFDSSTYGKVFSKELLPSKSEGVYIPSGFAHGIFSLEDNTYMLSMSSAALAPEQEGGISMSSIGLNIPPGAIFTSKDASLPTLKDYIDANKKIKF
jgi:dTDP-4-dehydrorhamnose 3,5-epimerase